ncbi:MAG TPA: KUP/HAK/KT family potassium transporter [Polyangiales bacterium]|nr:KUP/HAK/KT family potassium transporter [Polyangiales bacterium]
MENTDARPDPLDMNSTRPPVTEESAGHHDTALLHPSPRAMAALALGAMGVVYGDIGTSPLYALRECFLDQKPTHDAVLGVISLFFWSLTLVVVLKYLTFVLRADNRGEGGILALLALATPHTKSRRVQRALLLTGLIGSALLFADGMITPAISVLSAVEGLSVAAPQLSTELMQWLAIGILAALFIVQRSGTGRIGAFFGPAVLLWFLSIGTIGLVWIGKYPQVLDALNPSWAIHYLMRGTSGYFVLGSVVLCVTGGEALYADLGHFGRGPIRWAWYCGVFPALTLSYFGQGAYLLSHGKADVGNPFYEMVPTALLYPMVGIATVATVVASQALITGVFAMVHQAVQLGYLPRVTVVHTSGDIENRIYIPQANTMLAIACVALVAVFKSSSSLASAYGIAVTGTMVLTSVLFFAAMHRKWGNARTALISGIFLVVDLGFLGANVPKVVSGGWVPLAVAALFMAVMTTWQRGTQVVSERLKSLELPITAFLEQLLARRIARVPGTAVFLTREAAGSPPMLVHYVDHSLALQEHVILLTVQIDHAPRVSDIGRIETEDAGQGFYRVRARYGFMESPDLGRVLAECEKQGLPVSLEESTIFVGHSTVITTGESRMARWRKNLFELMNRNARPASTHYRLPSTRVVEIGVRIEI